MSSNEIMGHAGNRSEIVEGDDVAGYLIDRLSIEVDVVLRAIDSGRADAAMTTRHSPAPAFGSRLWEGAIRQLRDDLIPRGWTSVRPGQLEVVRNKRNTLQITAALGDVNVGNRAASPSCEHPRGASTARAVEINSYTFAGLAPDSAWEPIETWWLLYRPTPPPDGSIRAELSLPLAMSGRRITDWGVRVLLPVGAEGVDMSRGAVLPAAPPPVDVLLERRAN